MRRWMKTRAWIAGVAMMGTVAMGCNQDRAVATQRMNEGLGDLQSGRTSAAVEKLEEAVMKDPTYADPPYYLAQIYHQKYEQPVDAARYYKMALSRAPDNPQFMYRYGAILAEQEKHDDAITELQNAVDAHENFPKAWFRLGLSQLAKKDYVEGVASLSKSIEQDATMRIGPEDPGGAAYHALGDLYLRFNFYDKALQVYSNGIENNPEAAQLYRGQGVAQLKLGRHSEAVASFGRAIELDPSSATAYFNQAIAQRAAGDIKGALDSLERFLGRADPSVDQVRMSAAGGLRGELMDALEK